MGVAINETGADITPTHIHHLLTFPVVAHPGDATSGDSHVSRLNLPVEGVYYPAIDKQKVRRCLPSGHRDQFPKAHLTRSPPRHISRGGNGSVHPNPGRSPPRNNLRW